MLKLAPLPWSNRPLVAPETDAFSPSLLLSKLVLAPLLRCLFSRVVAIPPCQPERDHGQADVERGWAARQIVGGNVVGMAVR